MRKRRRNLLLAIAAVAVSIAVAAALALWRVRSHGPPDANRLTSCAARGDVAGVRHCLQSGVDPNAPSRWGWNHENEGQTPLTAAAQFGHVEVVRLLLEGGADPNRRDFGAEFPHLTPLATAAMHGQLEVCRVLLDAGAEPNLPSNPKHPGDPGNWTALDWALNAKQPAIADLLRRHGALENRRRSDGG
jgi:ankyrin repeat protein